MRTKALVCGVACALAASVGAGGPAADAPVGGELADFVRGYNEDWSSVRRFYPQQWSAVRPDRTATLCDEYTARLNAIDFDSLAQQGKIDWLLLRHRMEYEKLLAERQKRWTKEIEEFLPFKDDVLALFDAQQNMRAVDPQSAAGVLNGFAKEVAAVRKRLEAGKKGEKEFKDEAGAGPLESTPVLAKRASDATNSLRRSLATWYSYYDGYQPDFSWWVRKPYEEAAKTLDEYSNYLRKELAGLKGEPDDPLVGAPIGADGLAADLAVEMMPYTPAELVMIGEREFAWCEAEMKKASAEMGFGDDWKKALEKVKTQHAPPGGQDEVVAEQSREAIKFLQDKDLITLPPLAVETWRLEMSSPETQRYLPFAAYNEQAMTVGYPTDTMKHDDKLMSMRGNNIHFTRIVTPHELIPGHHLQIFMERRIRPHRQFFSTPFFIEGWCLYWEMMLWDKGWAKGPEDRVGMLFWRMHRCARIIVSLNFHLGTMSPQQMIDFLVDRVGHERMTATSEVRRYVGPEYSPLYQCGYMIGGMQLRALRRETVDKGTIPEKQFHDEVLTYGAIPMEMVRAGVMKLPLTRDWKAGWRFGEGK